MLKAILSDRTRRRQLVAGEVVADDSSPCKGSGSLEFEEPSIIGVEVEVPDTYKAIEWLS